MLYVYVGFPDYGIVGIKNLPSAYLSEDKLMENSDWFYQEPWNKVEDYLSDMFGENYAEWFPFASKSDVKECLTDRINQKQTELKHLTEMLESI